MPDAQSGRSAIRMYANSLTRCTCQSFLFLIRSICGLGETENAPDSWRRSRHTWLPLYLGFESQGPTPPKQTKGSMKPTRLNIELPTRKLNRIASKTPKSVGLFWCGKCDRNMIGLGEKCGVCGNKPPHKYFKKQDLT